MSAPYPSSAFNPADPDAVYLRDIANGVPEYIAAQVRDAAKIRDARRAEQANAPEWEPDPSAFDGAQSGPVGYSWFRKRGD